MGRKRVDTSCVDDDVAVVLCRSSQEHCRGWRNVNKAQWCSRVEAGSVVLPIATSSVIAKIMSVSTKAIARSRFYGKPRVACAFRMMWLSLSVDSHGKNGCRSTTMLRMIRESEIKKVERHS